MATYPLRRVLRLPDACFARWRSGAQEITIPITTAEYAALALKGAGAPPNRTGRANAVWLSAWSEPRYNTGDGRLAPGDVAQWTTGAGWFNGADAAGEHLVIGLEARDRKPLYVPRAQVLGDPTAPATLSMTTSPRAGISVVSGQLVLDEGRA